MASIEYDYAIWQHQNNSLLLRQQLISSAAVTFVEYCLAVSFLSYYGLQNVGLKKSKICKWFFIAIPCWLK